MIITALDFEIAAKRRADREALLDTIFASIAKKRANEREAASAPIAASPKPTVSDAAFERMRAAIERRGPGAPSPAYQTTRNDDEAAAAAILDALRTFEPASADERPSVGPVNPEDEAAVTAIMGAFRAAKSAI